VDHQLYLQDLKEIALREGCSVQAYVLMTNYVHLLMTPTGSMTPVLFLYCQSQTFRGMMPKRLPPS